MKRLGTKEALFVTLGILGGAVGCAPSAKDVAKELAGMLPTPVATPTAIDIDAIVKRLQPTAVSATEMPKPTATRAAVRPAVVPTNKPAVRPAVAPVSGELNIEVPMLSWTNWVRGNLVIPGAIQIRPSKPFEAVVPAEEGSAYQLKTDFDDSRPSTWRDGSLIYKFHIPLNRKTVFVGTQGDTGVMLCEANEEGQNMVWMRTEKGNGTSALVRFTVTDQNPALGQLCP